MPRHLYNELNNIISDYNRQVSSLDYTKPDTYKKLMFLRQKYLKKEMAIYKKYNFIPSHYIFA